MSALGSADSSAHGAAPLSTSPPDSENDASTSVHKLEVMVHPRFVRQLKEEPAVFCPLDWLPDEVISNVLVHLVSAPSREPRTRADVATSPRNPPPPRLPRGLPGDHPSRARPTVPTANAPRSPSPDPLTSPHPTTHPPPTRSQHGRDVARFSLVNRRARRLCEDDDVWRELCARHFDIRPENRDRPECGWNTLYQIHHNVLYSLFRDGGRQSPGLGTSDGFGRGIAAIAQGRVGGMSISLGAA